jgi:hypothetical protein
MATLVTGQDVIHKRSVSKSSHYSRGNCCFQNLLLHSKTTSWPKAASDVSTCTLVIQPATKPEGILASPCLLVYLSTDINTCSPENISNNIAQIWLKLSEYLSYRCIEWRCAPAIFIEMFKHSRNFRQLIVRPAQEFFANMETSPLSMKGWGYKSSKDSSC